MALIPITFQADLGDENAKGNMRPEDMAALFAFLYPQEVGILNITGQDCSQFGAINIVGSTAQVTFHKGYIVVQGRAIYIEEGTQVAFNLPASGQTSGVLGVKINLAESGATEVTWFQKTNVAQTDDLLANASSGIYEFVLYYYTATNLNLSLDKKTDQIIENANDYWKNADFITQEAKDNSKKIATTEFVKNALNNVFAPYQSDIVAHEVTKRNNDRLGIAEGNGYNNFGTYNECKIELSNDLIIYIGLLNNQVSDDYWYRFTLPEKYKDMNKYVFASLNAGTDKDHANITNYSGVITTYIDGKYIYLSKQNSIIAHNMQYMFVLVKNI